MSVPLPDPTRVPRGHAVGWRGPSVARATYGLIVVMSVLAVWTNEADPDGSQVLISVAATAVVFWLAHVYSAVMEARVTNGRNLTRDEARQILDHEWPLIEVAILPAAIVALGVVGLLRMTLAVDLALWLCFIEFVLLGAFSAWRSGARGLRLVLFAAVSATLGLGIVLLKALLH